MANTAQALLAIRVNAKNDVLIAFSIKFIYTSIAIKILVDRKCKFLKNNNWLVPKLQFGNQQSKLQLAKQHPQAELGNERQIDCDKNLCGQNL
jgi:hypothetical protein